MGTIWNRITKEQSNCKNQTASSQKNTVIRGQEKLILYLLNQSEHHEEVDTLKHESNYFQSEFWGHKLKKSVKDPNKIVRVYPDPVPRDDLAWNKFKTYNIPEELRRGMDKYLH